MEVTFGGKPCISANFSLELGFSPSTGNVVMSKRESPESLFTASRGPYALTMADEKSSITIQELYVKEMEPDDGVDGSSVYNITIQDKRWRWKYKFISGTFNTLTKDKKSVEKFSRRGTMELALELFKALGELPEGIGLVGAIDNPLPRFTDIKWEFDNPAQELEKMFKELGRVLSLRPDGKLKVYEKGFSTHAVQRHLLINHKKGKKDWERPTILVVAGGKNIKMEEISGWEPIVKSDGTIPGYPEDALAPIAKAISAWELNELNCRQAAVGFAEGKSAAWDEVEGLRKSDEITLSQAEKNAPGDDATKIKAKTEKISKRRQIMKDCFLRWFRIPKAEYPKTFREDTNFFKLPILKEIPEFFRPDTILMGYYVSRRHPIVLIKQGVKIKGKFGDTENADDLNGKRSLDTDTLLFRNPESATRIVVGENTGVSMDYELGIIKFGSPVGLFTRKEGDKEILLGSNPRIEKIEDPDNCSPEELKFANPEITVKFAHEVHDTEEGGQVNYPYVKDSYFFTHPTLKKGESFKPVKNETYKIIKRPEMRLFIDGKNFINKTELDNQARAIAADNYRNMFPETASEYVYAGFVNAAPDGKVTAVNWSFTDSGGLTEVKESNLTTVPKLVFGSPPRFYGGRSLAATSSRTNNLLGNRATNKIDDVAKKLRELEDEVKQLLGTPPDNEPQILGLINASRGALIPLSDSENKRTHSIFCRIVSRDPKTGAIKVDRVGPALGATWNSAQEGWEMGGGSGGKFVEWTPA